MTGNQPIPDDAVARDDLATDLERAVVVGHRRAAPEQVATALSRNGRLALAAGPRALAAGLERFP
jgi:hypothetical protein